MQVPEDEYFEEEQNQSQGFLVENSVWETKENAAEAEEKLAKEKEEELKAEKEKREEALKRIEAKEAERRKDQGFAAENFSLIARVVSVVTLQNAGKSRQNLLRKG